MEHNEDHTHASIRKLFTCLEEIFYTKTKISGKSTSPTFKLFVGYQTFFKIGGTEEFSVVYHHFESLYDNHKDFILADVWTWLNASEPIVLKIPDDKGAQLNLSSFYKVAESLGELGKGFIDDFQICLCRIFYSVTLKRSAIIKIDDQKELKKEQMLLLKKITPKPSLSATTGNPTDILSGLMRGIDISKAINGSGGGNLASIVDKLTNNANNVLGEMGVEQRIPNAIKTKITGLAANINGAIQENPDPDNLMRVAKEALGPKVIIDTEVTIEHEDGTKEIEHKVEKVEEKIEKRPEDKPDEKEEKSGKEEKKEEIPNRRRQKR